MTITDTIRDAVCRTMPETAAASGLITLVDPSAWIAEMSARFPVEVRPASLGLPGLIQWFREHGVTAGDDYIRALRLEWLKERMRDAADAEYAARKSS